MGHVVEQMIARDYLTETSEPPPTPLLPLRSTIGNFFDTGNLQDYKQLLKNRHPLEVDRNELDKRGDFKVPDISTWQGDFRERILGISVLHDKGRNEHYEIKPDNDGGTAAGELKLARITKDNRDLTLTQKLAALGLDPYKRGVWYPPEAKAFKPRKVHFTSNIVMMRGLQHKLRRWSQIMRNMGLTMQVHDIWIDVVRRRSGLLQYRICFELETDDDATDAFEDALAAKLVRVVYEYLTIGLTLAQRNDEFKFVDALRRQPPLPKPGAPAQDPKIPLIQAALDKEEKFEMTAKPLLTELEPLTELLRATLLTRHRAMPGDIFLVACDETYFQQEVTDVRTKLFAGRVQMLRMLYGGVPSFPSGMTVTRSAVLTFDEAVRALSAQGKQFKENPVQWLTNHKQDILRAVGLVIVCTALMVLLIMTAGTAAPVVVPLSTSVLAGSGVAAEAAVATGTATVGTAGTIAIEGTTVATATGTTAAGAGATSGLALGIDTAGLTQAQLTALRWGLAAAQRQAASALTQQVLVQSAIDESLLLGRAAAATGTTPAMNSAVLGLVLGTQADSQYAQALSDVLKAGAGDVWQGALAGAGPTVAAVSAGHIVATPAAGGVPAAFTIGIGKLYLLKLRSLTTLNDLPPLEGEFDWNKHTDDLKGSSDAPGRLRFVGVLRCRG
jgi:hypothetical protein